MTPRASLPSSDELFRKTTEAEEVAEVKSTSPLEPKATQIQVASATEVVQEKRHDEKVTFYCTKDDLTRLERARLTLRADHGISSDRGRLVRAALAEILDEFESRAGSSSLVRRLEQD